MNKNEIIEFAEKILFRLNETAPPIDIYQIIKAMGREIPAINDGAYGTPEHRWLSAKDLARQVGFQATVDINIFAATLLMPQAMILAVAGQYYIGQLSSLFGVPVEVLKVRINAK